jgi:hypothetical protein
MENRVMAQADSCRPLTADVWVRSQVSPPEICGAQSGNVTGFSPSTSVFPCQCHSTSGPYSFVTDAVWC